MRLLGLMFLVACSAGCFKSKSVAVNSTTGAIYILDDGELKRCVEEMDTVKCTKLTVKTL